MPTAIFEDFVSLSKLFFKTVGIKPYDIDDGGIRSLRSNFIFYTAIINMVVIVFFEVIYVLFAVLTGTNFVKATMTCSYIAFVCVGITKMIYIWSWRQELSLFMRSLMEIFPKTNDEQRQYSLTIYLKKCTLVTVIYSLLNMVLIWTYNLFAIMQYLIADYWLGLSEVGLQLPYILWVPWNYEDTWFYYFLYIVLCYAAYTSSAGQLASDLLLFSSATQVIMHYDYLAKSIQEFDVKASDTRGYCDKDRRKDMQFLTDIIEYHEKILSLSEVMNAVFGVPLLLNFMSSSFIICFLGFQMTIGVSMEILIKLSMFLFVSLMQVFLICYYGQELLDASKNIAQSVYNQNWNNAEERFKKMLILITARSQRPALLKATRFLCVSLGTMTDIMQMSYKFFALLRTMYSE